MGEEFILYIIIIVLLIVNNNKINALTSTIKLLENKIDYLKNLYTKTDIRDDIIIKKQEIVTQKTIKKPIVAELKPKITIKPIIKKTEKTLAESLTRVDEISKVSIKSAKQEDVKKSISPKETIGDKLYKKISDFKANNPDLEKFIGENLISKIGVLILVLGISFFVKYAIDKEWINEVARVGIGFLSGGILLAFAQKLRKNYIAFSSILVSGAITVFYFIITYAFKEYELFDQTVAFVLLVLITVFSVVISIFYNRKELGVLSLIGGFAVPLLVSTGSGNYTVLFSYLLILNIGFLVLSIKKKWFIINVLTFVFTHFFFFAWLIKDQDIAIHAVKLFAFAALFYVVFYVMNVYRVVKEKSYVMKPVVMSLFLISTFVFFAQGLYLLGYFAPYLKGGFTLLLAAINLVTGWLLLKNKVIDVKTVYLFIGMTLTFLTLTGPIQLNGNYITLFWAAESTLLIWLSQKIKNNDFKMAAFIITFLTVGSLLMDFNQIYGKTVVTSDEGRLPILFNKGFVTGLFTVITLLLSAFLFFKEKDSYSIYKFKIVPSQVKTGLIILAGVVFYLTGVLELTHQAYSHFDIYLSETLIVIYNFTFIITGIYFAFKQKLAHLQSIGLLFSILILLFSIVFIGSVPFQSFLYSQKQAVSNPTFYVQFIVLLAAIYLIKLVYIQVNKTKGKVIKYILATLFVILISLEVLIISQPILVDVQADGNYYAIIRHSKITVIKTSLPILWGLLSFVFLYFGIKRNNKEWRVFALILIAVTIVKLFTYDIGNVSEGGKIVAFIILGIVLLIISFMYQKIKKLFNDKE